MSSKFVTSFRVWCCFAVVSACSGGGGDGGGSGGQSGGATAGGGGGPTSGGSAGSTSAGGAAGAPAAGGGAAGAPRAGSAGMSAGAGGRTADDAGAPVGGVAGMPSGGAAGAANPNLAKFSFFVTSLKALQTLSGSMDGFGGDLRFGETGPGAGLRGADKICSRIAEMAMPGAGAKTWRAFLSATSDGNGGGPVHARSRVGAGPWYDARGRLVASSITQLLMPRPGDADAAIKNDLPTENGVPHHMDGAVGCTGGDCPDNHQVLTGTGTDGGLYTGWMTATDSTCNDWTTKEPVGRPWCGHSWSRAGASASFNHWMSSFNDAGCAPCARLVEMGGVMQNLRCVGSAGGYGGFYCLALEHQ